MWNEQRDQLHNFQQNEYKSQLPFDRQHLSNLVTPTLNIAQAKNFQFILYDQNLNFLEIDVKNFNMPQIQVNFIELNRNKSSLFGFPESVQQWHDSSTIDTGPSIDFEMFIREDWSNYLEFLEIIENQVLAKQKLGYKRQVEVYWDASLILFNNLNEYMFHFNYYYCALESLGQINLSNADPTDLILPVTMRFSGLKPERKKETFNFTNKIKVSNTYK